MRSTLLFVAVLLACAPLRAQSTAPPGAVTYSTWFDACFPEATTQVDLRRVIKRRVAAPRSFARAADAPVAVELPRRMVTPTPLLHSPNAP